MRERSTLAQAFRIALCVAFAVGLSLQVPHDMWSWLRVPSLEALPVPGVWLQTGTILAICGLFAYFYVWNPLVDWTSLGQKLLGTMLIVHFVLAASLPIWSGGRVYWGAALVGAAGMTALGYVHMSRKARLRQDRSTATRDEQLDRMMIRVLLVVLGGVWGAAIPWEQWETEFIRMTSWFLYLGGILPRLLWTVLAVGLLLFFLLSLRQAWMAAVEAAASDPDREFEPELFMLLVALYKTVMIIPNGIGLVVRARVTYKILMEAAFCAYVLMSMRFSQWYGLDTWIVVAGAAGLLVVLWATTWSPGFTHQVKQPFISDQAVQEMDQDRLARQRMAHILLQAINKAPAEDSYVVGLYGTWGTGKTSVMRLTRTLAEGGGHKTIWLNTWVYDDKLKIAKAFFDELTQLLRRYHIPTMPYSALARFRQLALRLLQGPGRSSPFLFGLGALFSAIPTEPEILQAKRRVSRIIGRVTGPAHRLIVFVDDLDRCSTESIVGTLEFLNDIADLKNTIFVIGIDHERVTRVLESRYGSGGALSLHKVINVSIELDAIRLDHLDELFRTDVRHLFGLEEAEARRVLRFIFEVVGGNPRKIKQLLNRMGVTQTALLLLPGSGQVNKLVMYWELLRLTYPDVSERLREPTVLQLLWEAYGATAAALSDGEAETSSLLSLWNEPLVTTFRTADVLEERRSQLHRLLFELVKCVPTGMSLSDVIALFSYTVEEGGEKFQYVQVLVSLQPLWQMYVEWPTGARADLEKMLYERTPEQRLRFFEDLVELKRLYTRSHTRTLDFDSSFFRKVILHTLESFQQFKPTPPVSRAHMAQIVEAEQDSISTRESEQFFDSIANLGTWDAYTMYTELWNEKRPVPSDTVGWVNLRIRLELMIVREFCADLRAGRVRWPVLQSGSTGVMILERLADRSWHPELTRKGWMWDNGRYARALAEFLEHGYTILNSPILAARHVTYGVWTNLVQSGIVDVALSVAAFSGVSGHLRERIWKSTQSLLRIVQSPVPSPYYPVSAEAEVTRENGPNNG